jgi:outer membrane protein assembly factor BamB
LSFRAGCDKSGAMNVARVLSVALPLLALCACSGGGGSGSAVASASWPKFRHDSNNTGSSSGVVGTGTLSVTWSVQVDASAPRPISSSPAVAQDGTIYVGSEGGTLAAVNSDGTIKWRATSCANGGTVCGATTLGALVSSPAVYTLNGETTVMIGSTDGRLFIFQDDGGSPSCNCFRPAAAAHFVSSPTFVINPTTLAIEGIFIGATIDTDQGRRGKLYAVNADGSQRWEFPRTTAAPIGPITSSPALGQGTMLYFTAADTETDDQAAKDNLYAVTSSGALAWRSPIGNVVDPTVPGAPASSPLVQTQIYIATADGNIFSINPGNGSPRWRVRPMLSSDDEILISSMAFGVPALTPTPESTGIPTSTPPGGVTAPPGETVTPTLTPTTTPTPVPNVSATPTPPMVNVFGVTKSGALVVIDVVTGSTIAPSGPLPTPIPTPVVSSPALSGDSFLVFGANDGKLHVVNTVTGTDDPVALKQIGQLPVAMVIRSSPAISGDGTIYVGADDGLLYAVAPQ